MEWNRAKTILIFSFLVLNVLLGYQLWASHMEVTQSNPDNEELKQEIQNMLRDKQIEVKTKLSDETPKLREITVQYQTKLFSGDLTPLGQAVPITGLFVDENGLKRQLSEQIPNIDEYQLDPAMTSRDTIVMHQLYLGYPMFDVNLKLNKKSGAVVSYSQQYVEDRTAAGQKEQMVLSGLTALGSLAENNHLQPGTSITDVRLGYHGQIFNSETQVLAPAWRIATAKGEIFYVQAITGGVMSDLKEKSE